MLPGQPGTLGRAMVESEARGAAGQLGQRGHFSRGHESLGQGHFQAVKADGQHSWTSHGCPPFVSVYQFERAPQVRPGPCEAYCSTAMELSVVIGTYNRAHLLAGTLGALAAQQVPPSLDWEIVVVDNNSTDATAQVVAAFSPKTAIPVRYVSEPRQGISHARNRGIREAQGSILAFTDDDVLPAPDWVSEVAAGMERWDAHGVGGRILPQWEGERPGWLTENRRPLRLLALMESAESGWLAMPLKPHPQVWGANMAFRREVFDRVGEFDPRRGVVGKRLFRGEESDLIERALDLGLKIAYDPTLTVFHRIGPDRMRKAYFRRLEFESARGEARLKSVGRRRSFPAAPLRLYRAAAVDFAMWAGVALGQQPRVFDRELRWRASFGALAGYW